MLEVTSSNNQSWLSMHVYIVYAWKRIPMLLSPQHVREGCTAVNVKDLLMCMVVYQTRKLVENCSILVQFSSFQGSNVVSFSLYGSDNL